MAAELDEVQTKRLDLGQDAVQGRAIQHAGEQRVASRQLATIDGKPDSAVGPRWPEIRIE